MHLIDCVHLFAALTPLLVCLHRLRRIDAAMADVKFPAEKPVERVRTGATRI